MSRLKKFLKALYASQQAAAPKKRKKPRQRLKSAYGLGTINCKAQIDQLVRDGAYLEARVMAEQHEKVCGERLYPTAFWRFST